MRFVPNHLIWGGFPVAWGQIHYRDWFHVSTTCSISNKQFQYKFPSSMCSCSVWDYWAMASADTVAPQAELKKHTADTDIMQIWANCLACGCVLASKGPVNSRGPDVGPGWQVDRVTRRDPAQDGIKLTRRDQACKTCLLNNTWSDSAVLGSFSSELYWLWQGQAERERERNGQGRQVRRGKQWVDRERGNIGIKRKLYQKVEVVADEGSGQKRRDRKREEER